MTVKPGEVLVGSDINSLEPHVLAHASQDPGYMTIYKKGASPNCIYCFLAAHSPLHGEDIRKIYDPYNSTAEAVSQVKKNFHEARQLYKICVLTLAYEGTKFSLGSSFKKAGMELPEHQILALIRLFRKTFTGLAAFRDKLKQEWKYNGGYIITGRGRPLAIPTDIMFKAQGESPAIAMYCQTTGHDFVLRWLWHMNNYRREKKLKCKPFVPDRHDASYWRTPEDEVEQTKEMIRYAYDRFNDEAQLTVELKGEIKVGTDMRIQ